MPAPWLDTARIMARAPSVITDVPIATNLRPLAVPLRQAIWKVAMMPIGNAAMTSAVRSADHSRPSCMW